MIEKVYEIVKGLNLTLMVLLTVLAAVLIPQGCNGGRGGYPRTAEIRLDFHPFTDPTSTFVALRGDGKASLVKYSPQQLIVVAAYEGVLTGPVISSLLQSTREPAFKAALRQRDFGGAGLSRGDQFYLLLSDTGGGIDGRCFGFVPDAPAIVRALIDDLLKVKGRLREVAAAGAYLRSTEIEKDRLERMRALGRIRFLPVGAFSSDLRPAVVQAIAYPFDFHALSEAQYRELLEMISQGRDFFVLDDAGAGHQLTLFRSRTNAITK